MKLEFIGILLSLVGLMWSMLQKVILDRKKNAIDIIRDWNINTSTDTGIIRKYFPTCYSNCEFIPVEMIKNILRINPPNTDSTQLDTVRDSIIRLFNYFEYISTAYLSDSVDRKIVDISFSVTMLRYYIVLENFILLEYLTTKRNPWIPYTTFIEKEIRKSGDELLCSCGNIDCKKYQSTQLLKNLTIINRGRFEPAHLNNVELRK